MQKKHSFSPNHKVVTDSKHNHHPFGAPTTASQGQPPAQMGAGGDGTQAPQDGGGEGGGMDGMNFCNGGMKFDDGGSVYDKAVDWTSRHVFGADDYDPNGPKKPPLAGGDQKTNPGEGTGGEDREKTIDSIVDKAAR